MTYKEFLRKIKTNDDEDGLTEEEIGYFFYGHLIEDEEVSLVNVIMDDPDRWDYREVRVYKIKDKFFKIIARIGDEQKDFSFVPCEVFPKEKVITVYEEKETLS